MVRNSIYLLALVFLFVSVGGCALGKKEWPSPVEAEDTFSISLVRGIREDNCLRLNLQVDGEAKRLSHVIIQYESVDDGPDSGCPGCPFMPRQGVRLEAGDSSFQQVGNTLRLSLCGLKTGVGYRFRVVAYNELKSLRPVSTDVFAADPQ